MTFDYASVECITSDLEGLYRIDHDAYHFGLGISSTKLKKALLSRARYEMEDDFDTASLSFGRAFHAALLEPALFAEKWRVSPNIPGHKNSNAYKEAVGRWLDEVKGKEIITSEEFSLIGKMIRCVKEHPAYEGLEKFDAEIMGITRCPDTGLQIKCKADLLGSKIIDFKTTSNGLNPYQVEKDAHKWGYHISAAFYQDIFSTFLGDKVPFVIAFVTKKEPFECEFYEMTDEILEEGRKLYKAALRRISKWKSGEKCRPKGIRKLFPSEKMVYATNDILKYIEES